MQEILTFIENHTVSIVITAVVIFFLIKFGSLGANYIGIKLDHLKHKLKHDIATSHEEDVKTILKITPEVKAVLKELVLQTHCSRAYIFDFHNGQVSMGGLPFIYMSCTYEVLSGTATSEYHARQRMPFTLYDTFIKGIVDKDVININVENQTNEFDPIVYETIKQRHTKILIATKLVDENKRVIGFLGIDFCKNDMFMFNDKAIKQVEKIVYKEAQILSTLLYAKIINEEVKNEK